MKFLITSAIFLCFITSASAAEQPIPADRAAAIENVFTNDIDSPIIMPAIQKPSDKNGQKTSAPSKKTLKNQAGIKSDMRAQSTPIFYSKDEVRVRLKSPPKAPSSALPWEKADTSSNIIALNVEIRDGVSLYNQNGWFNLSSYSDKTGVMMAFSEPTAQRPIVKSAQYAPVDILFIDKQGKITQIAPSIMLADLEQDIYPSSPILAFLFLKGGTCAELSINAGDELEYPQLFKKPPVILSAPKSSESSN